jgi:hypothetical protein
MAKTLKSRAEEKFSASQRKEQLALQEREKERQDFADRTAKLRALRLAKEAADKEAAEKELARAAKAVVAAKKSKSAKA